MHAPVVFGNKTREAHDEKAEVLGEQGPISGLYAAGEITGHFHGTAPNAVSVLRALVFGRIAGREAAGDLAAGLLRRSRPDVTG